MQAVILAAGMGRRLGELTQENTKCMVKVNGVPLIDRLLNQLSSISSLKRVIIVIGYNGDKLKQHIGEKYNDLKIEYIENPIYDKTNNIYSLSLANKELQEDDTLLIESDLIIDESLLSTIINNPYPNLALVDKYETWMDGTMVKLDEDHRIIEFVSKQNFRYNDVNQYFKTINIYKFSRDFLCNQYVPFLNAYTQALGNNEYYEQVLRIITYLDNCDLKALPIQQGQKWYEIDDIQDLDIAETLFASEEDQLPLFQKRYGGYWRFPRLLDFCYLVNPFFPPRKMKEEIKSNFDVLLTEYPSGMRVNSLLMAKYFGIERDFVSVGNGAAELIKSLMSKLDGIIGTVMPTFEEYPNRYNPEKTISFIPENSDYSYSASDVIDFFINKPIDTLLLINPDNPSGNFIPYNDLIHIIEWSVLKKIKIVIDESFVDFSDDHSTNSLLKNQTLSQYPNLIVIKSISKSYGVPGLRLGLLASSDKELINFIKKDVSIWNINSFAEFYMQIFGKYEKDYQKACVNFIEERKLFLEELKQIPWLRVIPSQANYFLCEISDKYSSKDLVKILLLHHNILIKDCSTKDGFEGKNYVRIAIRDRRDNEQIVNCLKTL
ncbi:MAG: aminotransferase class I/II-fold pyridoxal phosphate-dependent enzyme [Peptostreptococcales bacterium]